MAIPPGAAPGGPMIGPPPASREQLDDLEAFVDSWLSDAAENAAIAAVERGPAGERRWYVRVRGEEKDVWTIWFALGQRTLRYETYLTPPPEENRARFYEQLLRRNRRLTGLKLEIGPEDAVFLAGATAVTEITNEALDCVIGSMYAAVELVFRPAMRIGFASRFRG